MSAGPSRAGARTEANPLLGRAPPSRSQFNVLNRKPGEIAIMFRGKKHVLGSYYKKSSVSPELDDKYARELQEIFTSVFSNHALVKTLAFYVKFGNLNKISFNQVDFKQATVFFNCPLDFINLEGCCFFIVHICCCCNSPRKPLNGIVRLLDSRVPLGIRQKVERVFTYYATGEPSAQDLPPPPREPRTRLVLQFSDTPDEPPAVAAAAAAAQEETRITIPMTINGARHSLSFDMEGQLEKIPAVQEHVRAFEALLSQVFQRYNVRKVLRTPERYNYSDTVLDTAQPTYFDYEDGKIFFTMNSSISAPEYHSFNIFDHPDLTIRQKARVIFPFFQELNQKAKEIQQAKAAGALAFANLREQVDLVQARVSAEKACLRAERAEERAAALEARLAQLEAQQKD